MQAILRKEKEMRRAREFGRKPLSGKAIATNLLDILQNIHYTTNKSGTQG
jgi:hypothetical protein